jgi:hypothetical protein
MKKNHLKIITSIFITGAFVFIAFGSGDTPSSNSSSTSSNSETKKVPDNKICCVCSGTGKEQTSSGYRTCRTCYGTCTLSESRYSQVCN